jgi:hypothetical protein
MGREAVAVCHWKGEVAEVKALLESAEIILRGDIRARIPRSTITAIKVDEETLTLNVGEDRLSLELGAIEAEKWAAALLKPLPTLAQKLGIDASHKAFVIGKLHDTELEKALLGTTTPNLDDAAVIIAILATDADLDAAIQIALDAPQCPLWCVYPKGKLALLSDNTIRSTLRSQGFMDNKTSGVSNQLTATRYRLKVTA